MPYNVRNMSILIKNGIIYDGKGQPPFKKDILIRGKQVAAMGEIVKSKAHETIDAEGAFVMPGFIDVNSRVDRHLQIFTDPFQEELIEQGIVTAIGGNGGSSLAPMFKNSIEEMMEWGNEPALKMNADWQAFRELTKVLKRMGLGVNFGSLIGYSSIKRALTGNRNRDLTEPEMETFKKVVKKSFKDGALGISTGFRSEFSKKTPKEEMESIVRLAAESGKVYATSLREPEGDPVGSLKEIISFLKKTNANVEINNFMPLEETSLEYLRAKENLENEISEYKVNFDCQPYPDTELPIRSFLPEWLRAGDIRKAAEAVRSGNYDREITEYLEETIKNEIIITHAPKGFESLENKKLKDVSETRNKNKAETLLEIMKDTRLRAVCLFGNVSQEALEEFMISDASLIGSGETDVERIRQPFLKFINWAEKDAGIPFEKAIMKTSSLPAAKFGIKRRGVIKENNYADILVVKNGKIHAVIVNGQIAYHEGVKKVKAGEIIT